MARSVRTVVSITCGLGLGVGLVLAAAGCGSGVQTRDAAATTTTLSVDDERLAGEFATAMQRLLRMRQVPSVSAADGRCAGDAVVGAVGLERIRDAGLTPSEVTSIDSLSDGGVELSDDEVDALGDAIAACLPEELGTAFTGAVGIAPGSTLEACMSDGIIEAVADALARQVVDGEVVIDTVGFAEGMVAGVRCRWKSQPEGPGSVLTIDDGRAALEGALIGELSAPPSDIDTFPPDLGELDCFVSTVVDTLGESNLADSGATVRELARFLTGEGPDAIGMEVTPEQAEALARSYLDCVQPEALVRAQLEFAGVPEEAMDSLVDCIMERLPEDSLLDNAALNFELGVGGQATPRGEEILGEQARVSQECAQEVQATTPS